MRQTGRGRQAVTERERQRETERERERERDRETERQRDRETERQRDRETSTHAATHLLVHEGDRCPVLPPPVPDAAVVEVRGRRAHRRPAAGRDVGEGREEVPDRLQNTG